MAAIKSKRVSARVRRKAAIRKRLSGTTERPRLCVFRTHEHMYAQVIDDTVGKTLVAASTCCEEIASQREGKKKTERAAMVGKLIAERCAAAGVKKVVFDRNGFIFHGRIKAVADAAREAGLEF